MPTSWIQLAKEHIGKTAGAVLNEEGASFAGRLQRLVVIYGEQHDAVACDLDDLIRASDSARGIFELPPFIKQN